METRTSNPVWTDAAVAWKGLLDDYFLGPDFKRIDDLIRADSRHGTIVYPPDSLRFRAFELTPIDTLRCVILGQDPYHQQGQANGLAFSVNPGIAMPPSLRNILKELKSEYPNTPLHAIEKQGDLSMWATQGVLLLNTLLSVRSGQPLSHQNTGWEPLIKQVIHAINQQEEGVVFVLWGKSAQAYKSLIDISKHSVIESVHPSPLSAHRGFFGSKPFSKINKCLKALGKPVVNW
jgi:uracil-DNA glycosylase